MNFRRVIGLVIFISLGMVVLSGCSSFKKSSEKQNLKSELVGGKWVFRPASKELANIEKGTDKSGKKIGTVVGYASQENGNDSLGRVGNEFGSNGDGYTVDDNTITWLRFNKDGSITDSQGFYSSYKIGAKNKYGYRRISLAPTNSKKILKANIYVKKKDSKILWATLQNKHFTTGQDDKKGDWLSMYMIKQK